nr:unnamed protein product [Callosobruchus analis]
MGKKSGSQAPRGKDSVESKKILIIGDETARGCASKLKTYVTLPNCSTSIVSLESLDDYDSHQVNQRQTKNSISDIINMFHINIQCLSNKIGELSVSLKSENFTIICLSEHWMAADNLKSVNIDGYKLISAFCRNKTIHGGVAIFTKPTLKCRNVDLGCFCREVHTEMCAIEFVNNNEKYVVVSLYRSCLGDFNIFLHQFEDALNTLSEHYEKIIIMGDFNVNFIGNSNSLKTLKGLISSYNIDFTIFEPTRLGSSPSCIDNILTNISKPYSSKVIECCLSDHLAQIIQIETKENIKCGTEIRWTRKINQKLLNKFSKHLELADWSIFNRCSDIESLSLFVVDTYATFIRKTFPLEKISEKRPPVRWSNNSKLREMKDTLCAIKDIYNITKSPTDKRHYEAYRQLYKKSITDTRKQCYEKFIANSNNKSKSSWRIVNYETNRNNRQRETQLPPDTLNTYFTTIACEIILSLPPKNDEYSEYLNHAPKPNVTFFLEPVTELDVINAINRLSNSDSLDAYGINSKIVKQTLHILSSPLCLLINMCFSEGIFPDAFKLTRVIPIFKGGKEGLPENYRPISVICVFGKIIEIILKNRLSRYFEKHRLLHSCQFGFRERRSKVHALCKLIEDIVNGLDKGEHAILRSLDLTKAFDCVSHKLLIEKLEYYGIRGPPLELVRSYLFNRKQYVTVNNEASSVNCVKAGIPQGSVLGPVLFIIYVNDLLYYLFPVVMFADDTTIYHQDNVPNLHMSMMNMTNRAEAWFNQNNLKLNQNKTQTLVVSSNNNVRSTESIKLLGVYIDSSLNWCCHIDKLCAKISSQIFLLRQLKHLLITELLINLYFALIHSNLNYGIILWGNCSAAEQAFKLQKRAVRIIAGVGSKEHCKPLFIKFSIMSLPNMYMYQSLLEIHSHPDKYICNSDYHSYHTRHANLLREPMHRLKMTQKNSLSVTLYNKLPDALKRLDMNHYKYRFFLRRTVSTILMNFSILTGLNKMLFYVFVASNYIYFVLFYSSVLFCII